MHTKDVFLFDRTNELVNVSGRCAGIGRVFERIAVNEVEVFVLVRCAVEEGCRGELHGIPANVRKPSALAAEKTYIAGYPVKPRIRAALLAACCQDLHADTNTKERRRALHDHLVKHLQRQRLTNFQ